MKLLSVYQEVTSEELTSVAEKILRGKAHGIDGVPDMMVKALPIKNPVFYPGFSIRA